MEYSQFKKIAETRPQETFPYWFDAEMFDWRDDSEKLAEFYPDQFNVWFDPEKFNWSWSWALAKYCSKNFDQWFNSQKFDWERSGWALAVYCPTQFKTWFDPSKLRLDDLEELIKYCKKDLQSWISGFQETIEI